MSSRLAKEMAARISSGLARKSATSCSRWAEQYRVLGPPFPGKWGFGHHPWLRGIMDDENETVVFAKGAQIGASESALNRVFYTLDVHKQDVMYVLPSSTPDAATFSSGRFDPALEMSPHLRRLFSGTHNVGLKSAGSASLYIRGSRAPSGLKSVPCGAVVMDELDEFDAAAPSKIFERLSGQVKKSAYLLSTPTKAGFGIDAYYQDSTKQSFFFNCPSCSKLIRLVWPDSLVITADSHNDPSIKDSHYICTECRCRLNHEDKVNFLANGQWVAENPGFDYSGYHLNQLYSTTVKPEALAKMAIRAQSDRYVLTEFLNQKLGLVCEIEGDQVTDDDINNCIADYKNGELSPYGLVTMGVDTGKNLHYVIAGWGIPEHASGIDISIYAEERVLKFGTLKNFEDLDTLMHQWGVNYCVIDGQPEIRKSLEFANRFYGRVKRNYYSHSANTRSVTVNEGEQTVTADRTLYLDLTLGRVRRGRPWLSLPGDIDSEYREHLKALKREYREDQYGRPIGRWVKPDKASDHYAHAQNYAEIALPLALSMGRSSDLVTSVL